MGHLDSTLNQWRETAWNGIRFMVPDNWEIKEIGFRYIVLGTNAEPVLEIKWNRVKGNFSHRRHLKRLTKSCEKIVRRAAESPLPEAWQSALAGFESTGFSWQGSSQRGIGVLLFCPTCRNATLIQFIENGHRIKKTFSQRILASFRDHAETPVCRWAVFDIRADLPESLRLKRYRFESGKFELTFNSKTRRITLLRWAPASIILSGTSLEAFAGRSIAFSPGNAFRICADHAQPTVESKTEPSADWYSRLGQALKKNYPFKHARCWHLADKNRILGINIEGQSPINPAEMESLCIAYESL